MMNSKDFLGEHNRYLKENKDSSGGFFSCFLHDGKHIDEVRFGKNQILPPLKGNFWYNVLKERSTYSWGEINNPGTEQCTFLGKFFHCLVLCAGNGSGDLVTPNYVKSSYGKVVQGSYPFADGNRQYIAIAVGATGALVANPANLLPQYCVKLISDRSFLIVSATAGEITMGFDYGPRWGEGIHESLEWWSGNSQYGITSIGAYLVSKLRFEDRYGSLSPLKKPRYKTLSVVYTLKVRPV